jgi:hypothetical protein
MIEYKAAMVQTASCVVSFQAPEGATKSQLEEAAYSASGPSLCHRCCSSDNKSLSIDGEWDISIGVDGEPEIFPA